MTVRKSENTLNASKNTSDAQTYFPFPMNKRVYLSFQILLNDFTNQCFQFFFLESGLDYEFTFWPSMLSSSRKLISLVSNMNSCSSISTIKYVRCKKAKKNYALALKCVICRRKQSKDII